MIRESVIEFGSGRRLVGVLAHAASGSATRQGSAAARPPVVLLTNAGIIHRVGPNRVHVRLARALAARGYSAFRYDVPSVGDSESIPGAGDVQRDQVTGTCAAMTALQRAGIADQFIIFGICAGADHAFTVAATDPRVVGTIMVDPTRVFSTARHRLHATMSIARRALRLRSVWRVASGGLSRARSVLRESPDPGAPQLLDPARDTTDWQLARDTFGKLCERDVQLMFVMTRHNSRVFSYDQQMHDAFPDLTGLQKTMRSVIRAEAEHTFTRERDREFLEELVTGWVSQMPARQAAGAPDAFAMAR